MIKHYTAEFFTGLPNPREIVIINTLMDIKISGAGK
jgi:hypothetical protein